jgi:dienelactone hydrolase
LPDVVLFHHVLGRTDGVLALADELRQGGHTVHTPDLFEGRTFPSIDEGMAYADGLSMDELLGRAARGVEDLPAAVVYAGISLGVLPAQQLAQTRDGALGALLFEACVPLTEFGDGWPEGLPVQVHGMDADPFFAGEGDIDAARELTEQASASARAELFVYPGDKHLFVDNTLPSYDADAAKLATRRVLDFLSDLS